MGMYTEFYFRANVKDGPVADWLEANIVGGDSFEHPYDDHPFFFSNRWYLVFIGGGAVYQPSRDPVFRRSRYTNSSGLILASSLKNYGDECKQFVDWITPHLQECDGAFLGYELYEDTDSFGDQSPDAFREHPTLYFHNREPVYHV